VFPPNQSPAPTKFQSNDWSSFTPRFTLNYKISPDISVYATYAEGFKGGGYSVGSVATPYEPETLKDYEVGLKAEWLDRRLRTNLAAFYYDYSNLQVQKVLATGTLFENAAKAEIKGLELESSFLPTDRLRIDFNAALLDATYTEFETTDPARSSLGVLDLSGNRIAQSPRYSATLAMEYVIPSSAGEWTLRGESVWVDKVYFNQFNRDVLSQDAHNKLNAFATYRHPGGAWSATAYARNITDETIIATAVTSNPLLTTPVLGTYEPPRTFGVEIGYSF
jgi:iron complex outermembrane receptor protein